jgi:phosphoglycerate kinase
MENKELDSRLRLFQQANMKGKVVLVRVDHNVVKNGIIKDPYRLKPVEALMEEGS